MVCLLTTEIRSLRAYDICSNWFYNILTDIKKVIP